MRLSKEKRFYIESHKDTKSPEVLSIELRISKGTVMKYLDVLNIKMAKIEKRTKKQQLSKSNAEVDLYARKDGICINTQKSSMRVDEIRDKQTADFVQGKP